MTAHDWTLLDNGWTRHSERLCKSLRGEVVAVVYDDGDVWTYGENGSPGHTLEILQEALAQHAKCRIPDPKFKFGDWVRTADGREWQIVRERGKGMYLLLVRDGVTLSWDNEYALEAIE